MEDLARILICLVGFFAGCLVTYIALAWKEMSK